MKIIHFFILSYTFLTAALLWSFIKPGFTVPFFIMWALYVIFNVIYTKLMNMTKKAFLTGEDQVAEYRLVPSDWFLYINATKTGTQIGLYKIDDDANIIS